MLIDRTLKMLTRSQYRRALAKHVTLEMNWARLGFMEPMQEEAYGIKLLRYPGSRVSKWTRGGLYISDVGMNNAAIGNARAAIVLAHNMAYMNEANLAEGLR
jgi:hypothetical protein